MTDIDQERVLALERVGQRRQLLGGNLHHVTAAAADEVDMLLGPNRVVGGCAMGEMSVGDQPQLLQQLQGAIDGGDINASGGARHLSVYLVRSGATQGVDRF